MAERIRPIVKIIANFYYDGAVASGVYLVSEQDRPETATAKLKIRSWFS